LDDGRFQGEECGAMVKQRSRWGRAYRNDKLVCARVHVTVGHDDRLGLSRAERRYLAARFVECVDATLRDELASMVRRRGSAARRIAESLEPLLIVSTTILLTGASA